LFVICLVLDNCITLLGLVDE